MEINCHSCVLVLSTLVACSCELVAVASQNNERIQAVFYSAIGKLLQYVRSSEWKDGLKIKALYAVSCK